MDLPLPEHLAALPLTELHFTLQPRVAGRLPPFIGPALRGALGHALRLAACPMQCQPAQAGDGAPDCLHGAVCAYATLFDPPHAPGTSAPARPFVLLPPPIDPAGTRLGPDAPLQFGLRLFGPAVRHVPGVIAAVARLGRLGLGNSESEAPRDAAEREAVAVEAVRRLAPPQTDSDRFEADALVERLVAYESGRLACDLISVTDLRGETVWAPGLGLLGPAAGLILGDAEVPGRTDRLRLRLDTPLRIEIGKQVERRPTARTLVRATLLRLESLSQSLFGRSHEIAVRPLLDAASTITTTDEALRPTRRLERYSSSQRRLVPLDGVEGHLDFAGEALGDVAWLFRLAEILHLGSDTVQGLGRLTVEVP